MSTTHVQSLPNVRGRMSYTRFGEGERRREHLKNGTDRIAAQMGDTASREDFIVYCEGQKHRHPNAVNEGYEVRISWATDELDPSRQDDIQRGTPKNIYSYRDVHLNSRGQYIIEWFIADNRRAALWERGRYKDKGYIFTTNTGNPYNIQYIGHKLRRIQIPGKHITTHMFRHTHISMLAEMAVPLKAIMQRVGHNDPNTTLSIYTHVTNAMTEEANRKIDALSV